MMSPCLSQLSMPIYFITTNLTFKLKSIFHFSGPLRAIKRASVSFALAMKVLNSSFQAHEKMHKSLMGHTGVE